MIDGEEEIDLLGRAKRKASLMGDSAVLDVKMNGSYPDFD